MYRQEYVAMGLYHIAKAVSFINSDCKLVGTADLHPVHTMQLFYLVSSSLASLVFDSQSKIW